MGVLADDHIETFACDGFVVVPGLLSDEELDRFGPEVDAGVSRRTAGDTRALHEKSRYEQSFRQCINLWEDCDGVRPLTFHPRLGQAAAELLGCDAVRVWHDQALYKEPGGRETDAHQDFPYWPLSEPDAVTAWIPLDGSTFDAGAMGYVPASHRSGFKKFVNIFGDGAPDDVLARPELGGRKPVFVEVARGGVAFHHALTFHVARPNRTGRVRRVHTVIYIRDGVTRGRDFPHQSVDRGGIAVGEPVRSDVTPLAWPRQAGHLPAPPPPPARSYGGRLPSQQQGGPSGHRTRGQ